MKITIVDKKETPKKFRTGFTDGIIEQASKLTGTKTLKIESSDGAEAQKLASGLCHAIKRMKMADKVEACRRGNIVYVYSVVE
jgi:hypothetical protein